jgi:post-segregation antitoxin (ccd killing protein)
MSSVHHFVSLPLALHDELNELAQQRGVSVSDILIESLVEHLEEHRGLLWQQDALPVWSGYEVKPLFA